MNPATHCEISRFVVLGCGHTGTTLISGLLHINGYRSFKVSTLFENIELNDLNQRILDGNTVTDAAIMEFLSRLEKKTSGKWSLKDPRLSETAPRFYRLMTVPVKIIFNYREPGATVRSLIRERELHESYLSPDEMLKSAEDEWLRRNRAAVAFLRTMNRSPVLVTSYDEMLSGRDWDAFCRFIGHPLDMSFIEPAKRNSGALPVRRELHELHSELDILKHSTTQEVLASTPPVALTVVKRRTVRTRAHLLANRATNSWRARTSDARRRIARDIRGDRD